MDNENMTEPCYKCDAHFKRSEMQKLEIFNSPINVYMCNSCFAGNQEQSEQGELSFKDLDLFI